MPDLLKAARIGRDHRAEVKVGAHDEEGVAAESLSLKQEQLQQKQLEVQESGQLMRDQLWGDEQQKAYVEQNKRGQQLHFKRIEHQQKIGRLSQEQRMKLQHTAQVDQRKLQSQSQLDQQKHATKLRQIKIKLTAKGFSKAKNKGQIAIKRDGAVVQKYEHKRRMDGGDICQKTE